MNFSQVEKQMAALGENIYEIAKMRWSEEKNRALSIDDILTIDKIRERAKRYALDEINGENLYIRAIPQNRHPIIFIDDTTPAATAFLREQGIIPACTVQTSTDEDGIPRLHCWYRMPEKIDVQTRKAVEKVLINRLHAKFPHPDPKKRPGDVGSNDGQHRGRLAGSWNHGLGKERDCPVTLLEASGHVLSSTVADALLDEAAPFIDYSPKRKPSASLMEIQEHKYERPSIEDFYRKMVVPKMDSRKAHYQQDIFAIGFLIKSGFCELDIKKVLLLHDPNPIEKRKAGREDWFLETIFREVEEALGKKAPSPQGGGEVLMLSAGACASVPPSPLSAANPGAVAPGIEKPYPAWGDGKRKRGSISPDGKISFGVAPAPEKPVQAPVKPRRRKFGVKPRY